MRFIHFLCCLVVISGLTFLSCNGKKAEAQNSLTVYCYDSFASDWGPGPVVIPAFEEATGIDVQLIALGDAGQVLAKAILEKQNPKGDILLGIDNNMLPQALEAGVLEAYTPKNAASLPKELIFDPGFHLTPYDYGNFAIIYDSEALPDPPKSLEELAVSSPEKSIILMDPRTSSPGFGFLLWTIAVYGDEYLDFWKRLSPKILTITDGWDSGYGLFTSGEAPMVLSYTTSPAYHMEYENSQRYRAMIFPQGHYGQIEGVGIIKGTKNRKAARKFIDFVVSEAFQKEIPLTNWMYPVLPGTVLPASFELAPKPEKTLLLDPEVIERNRNQWIKDWTTVMTE